MSDFAFLAASPRRIRQTNAVAAMQAIFAHRRLSRADLARQLGLNRSSTGHIVSELTAAGLVREVAQEDAASCAPARTGRPGILLELVPDAAVFVGAEIGVEHITTLLIDLAANVAASRVEPFDGRSAGVKEAIDRAMAQAFDDMPSALLDRCEGFGLAAPAQMDPQGHVRIAPLLGWRDVDLAAITRKALPIDVPASIENDANAFAIGESYVRRDSREGVTLFLVIESGVGGGIVVDGELFRGGHGLAGEIGHIHVAEDGAELEELIGLRRVLERHRAASGVPDAGLGEFLGEVRDRSPAAVSIAEEWSRHLAFALVQACRLIDPDRIVLGGSVAALYPLVAARVGVHVEALQPESFPQPDILVHEAPETGAAYGAACMLHRRFLSLGNGIFADEAARTGRGAG